MSGAQWHIMLWQELSSLKEKTQEWEAPGHDEKLQLRQIPFVNHWEQLLWLGKGPAHYALAIQS
jgi:hypothetical protein